MSKGGGATEKTKGANNRWNEQIRSGRDVEETRRKRRRKKSGKENHRQEEKAAEHLKSSVINQQVSIIKVEPAACSHTSELTTMSS